MCDNININIIIIQISNNDDIYKIRIYDFNSSKT